jgi:hypothetical protein
MTDFSKEAMLKRRIEAALVRDGAAAKLRDAIEQWQAENIRHARSNSTGDYLDLCAIEYRIAKLCADAFQWDTCDIQDFVAEECATECSYDLKEGCALDDNGEPIAPSRSFGSAHPDNPSQGY